MRLKITFEQLRQRQIIPIDYQYYISSFIYRVIELSDSDYSKWLHDSGYIHNYNQFKFFTFSFLNVREREILPNSMMKIISPKIELTLSFISDKSIQHLLAGIFQSKRMEICYPAGKALFNIRNIEMIPDPVFSKCMRFRTISPIVLSKSGKYKEKESKIYLNPADEGYFEYFKKNLEEKYITFSLYNKEGIKKDTLESFNLLNTQKSKLISIAEGKESHTYIKGYLYDFEVTGNPDMIRIGYETGFGKYSSLGFGCVKVI